MRNQPDLFASHQTLTLARKPATMQAKRRPTRQSVATLQTPLNLDLAPDATRSYKLALELLKAAPGGLNRYLQDPSRCRNRLNADQVAALELAGEAEEAAAASRLPIPAATLPELLALPERPSWLPEGRAREVVLVGAAALLEHVYPHILHLAAVRRTKRRGMTPDDLVSALTAAARAEIARWDPERISPSRRKQGLGVMGIVAGVKSFLSTKLANGSIERDWLSAPHHDARTDSMDAPIAEGLSIADTVADGGESPADLAAAREQGEAIVAILHRNPSDTARAAERYLIRELGLPNRRPRQIGSSAGARLKTVAAGGGLNNCQTSLGAILEEIETAARILANRETIATAKMERGEPEYLRLARAAGLR